MSFDLYVWKTPRDIDADEAAALVERWQAAGGDPAASPFERTTEIPWVDVKPRVAAVRWTASSLFPGPLRRPRPRAGRAR